MEEQILGIIRSGRNFTAMAEDITSHVMEFIEWLQGNEVFAKIHNTHLYVDFEKGSKTTFTLGEVYLYWLNIKIK